MTSKNPPPESTPSPSTAKEAVKRVGKQAAVRLGATQFVRLARAPFIAFLTAQVKAHGDAGLIKHIATFAESAMGESAMSALLSVTLPHMPVPKGYEGARDALVEELRIRSFEVAGNVVAEFATGPLRDIAVAFLASGGNVQTVAPGGMLPAAVTAPLDGAVSSAFGVMGTFGGFSAPTIPPAPGVAPSATPAYNPFMTEALRTAAGETGKP